MTYKIKPGTSKEHSSYVVTLTNESYDQYVAVRDSAKPSEPLYRREGSHYVHDHDFDPKAEPKMGTFYRRIVKSPQIAIVFDKGETEEEVLERIDKAVAEWTPQPRRREGLPQLSDAILARTGPEQPPEAIPATEEE